MKIHKLTKEVDDKERLERAYLAKANETIARYESQVMNALLNPATETYREIVFTGTFAYSTRTLEQGTSSYDYETVRACVGAQSQGWFRAKKPVLLVYGSRHNQDNRIWYAEVLKFLIEREV